MTTNTTIETTNPIQTLSSEDLAGVNGGFSAGELARAGWSSAAAGGAAGVSVGGAVGDAVGRRAGGAVGAVVYPSPEVMATMADGGGAIGRWGGAGIGGVVGAAGGLVVGTARDAYRQLTR